MNTQVLSDFSQVIIIAEDQLWKLFLRGKLLATVDSLLEAIPAMLGFYYVMDMDYPLFYDLPFHILQYILFNDNKVPLNLSRLLDNFMDKYTTFKIDRLKQR